MVTENEQIRHGDLCGEGLVCNWSGTPLISHTKGMSLSTLQFFGYRILIRGVG